MDTRTSNHQQHQFRSIFIYLRPLPFYHYFLTTSLKKLPHNDLLVNVLTLRIIPSHFVVNMFLLVLASMHLPKRLPRRNYWKNPKSSIFRLYCCVSDLKDPWFITLCVVVGRNPRSTAIKEACHNQEDIFEGLCICKNYHCTTGFNDEKNCCDKMDYIELYIESVAKVHLISLVVFLPSEL